MNKMMNNNTRTGLFLYLFVKYKSFGQFDALESPQIIVFDTNLFRFLLAVSTL